ncbi:phage major capsid protein [Catellatospora sichuanensis]|uniref:phage major capsid protein n=1 Tax=Catellatospora sichuanensis TaxID=1969805 RepID=UPI001642DC80|nr:phage major capsid protein [Catellatospora sichuanensis]
MDFKAAATVALEKRARAFEERKRVLEDKVFTDEEKRSRISAIDADIDALAKEADGHVRAAESEVETRAINERMAKLAGGSGEQRGSARDEAAELRALARGEVKEVDFDLRTAQSVGGTGAASNTKQTTFVAQVLEAMRERSAFFSYARLLTTSGGETMEWPVKNALNPATAPVQLESGSFGPVTENTAYSKANTAWSKTNIGAYKYGVITEATQEIVDDSELPILSILAEDAGEALADAIVADLLVGAGTTKPWGWITRATAQNNYANFAGALTFDNLLDLQFGLKAPYRRNGVYMFNDSANPILRKLKGTDGQYVWNPSVQAGMPDTLWGKPVLTDPNILTVGAGAKVAAFGDPSKYLIRQVKSLKVTRSDEYGFDRDVIAFKVNWRGSGDLFDTNSVKCLTVTA